MLAIAIGQGVAIAWWRKLQGGASIQNLHHSWGFSTSLVSLFKGWRYLNLIALAALAAKIALIDGILLHRATETYQDLDPIRNVIMQIAATADFPTTGIINDHRVVTFIDPTFTTCVVTPWAGCNGGLSAQDMQNCNGICIGTFHGVGFLYSRSTPTTELIVLNSVTFHNATTVPIFSADFAMRWANATKDFASIFLNVLSYNSADMTSNDCAGTVTRQTCG